MLSRSYAPHPGAVSTYTVLGDTLGCNTGTTAPLYGTPLRLGHGVKVKVGTPMGYPVTGLEIRQTVDILKSPLIVQKRRTIVTFLLNTPHIPQI